MPAAAHQQNFEARQFVFGSKMSTDPKTSPVSSAMSEVPHAEVATSTLLSDAFEKLEVKRSHCPAPVPIEVLLHDAGVAEETRANAELGDQNKHLEETTGSVASRTVETVEIESISQDIIDKRLFVEILKPLPRWVKIEKFVEKSNKRTLLKISTESSKSKFECPHQFQYLGPVDVITAKDPERVANLVHAELENFLAKLGPQHCKQCGLSNSRGNLEWYDIDESVAIKSVQMWCDFVKLAYTSDGSLEAKWWRRIQANNLFPKPSDAETEYLKQGLSTAGELNIASHHELRNSRYRKWLTEGQAST